MEILLMLTLALSLVSALTGGAALWLLTRPDHTVPAPAEDDPPWEEPPRPAPGSGGRAMTMDEGFENLMAYQVRLGRGKTTGGEAQ